MSRRVIYVGGPYTHADHNIRRERFEALNRAAVELIKLGHIVYSPISHTHPLDVLMVRDDVHLSSDLWCDFDETFMSVCTEMVIVPLEGWDRSSGVRREREYFEKRGLPVRFYDEFCAELEAGYAEAAALITTLCPPRSEPTEWR